MADGIAVVNSGSSSIKFSLYTLKEEGNIAYFFGGQVDGIGVAPRFVAKEADGKVMEEKEWSKTDDMVHGALLEYIFEWIRSNLQDITVCGVGHRVVHGGSLYNTPVRVTSEIIEQLETFTPLAPLHQPNNLTPIRAIAERLPELPQIACFDTAFHRTQPNVAQAFALPRSLTDEGVRRYGFHGLSYEYIARTVGDYASVEIAHGRVIVAHLGSGASMCAIKNGKSITSSMGFSALDGLPMGTRTGTLDAGVILYLLQAKKMSPSEIENLLYKQSGLLGVSGISNDMRVLLESDDSKAEEAIELFVYRINRELGSLMAALGGLDAFIFTAGIGENSPEIRQRICSAAAWAGIRYDDNANQSGSACISAAESPVSVWVIPTNEELMIATHTLELLET